MSGRPASWQRQRASLCTAMVLLAMACSSRGSPPVPAPVADTTLAGEFRWDALDDRPVPAEFPAGSGAMLVSGSLELRPTPRDTAGYMGRFALRFGLRVAPADTVRATGQSGRFRVVADSLHFTPDGASGRTPVRFRYSWRTDGSLLLTDTQGHAWRYVRR